MTITGCYYECDVCRARRDYPGVMWLSSEQEREEGWKRYYKDILCTKCWRKVRKKRREMRRIAQIGRASG